jgi:hypothetical protein
VAVQALIRKDAEIMVTSILAAAEAESTTALPFPAEVFGLAAIAVFALLLVATLAFRNAGNRR